MYSYVTITALGEHKTPTAPLPKFLGAISKRKCHQQNKHIIKYLDLSQHCPLQASCLCHALQLLSWQKPACLH